MPDQQKYTGNLAGKHVLVIGGTSGLGYGVAEAALEHGARVTISSSNPSRLDSALERLKKSYPSATAKPNALNGYTCNLAIDVVEEQVKGLFEKTGAVDHVVHTAGDRLSVKPLAEATVENIHSAGDVRFTSVIIVAKYAQKYLSAGPEASFIITSGGVADRPHADWDVVAGYAAGLYGLTRNLAFDMKPVRVNCVSPGLVDTELWNHMETSERQKMLDGVAKHVPTGVAGRPEDVVQAFVYLMLDRNCTGQVVKSDSGSSLV